MSEDVAPLGRPSCCICCQIAIAMSLLRSLPVLRALNTGLAGSQCWAAPAAASLMQQQQPSSLLQAAAYSAQPQEAGAQANPFWAVPEGHQQSDLSDVACNIGLSRRKDLTLREDVRLAVGGQSKTLAELLKVWARIWTRSANQVLHGLLKALPSNCKSSRAHGAGN